MATTSTTHTAATATFMPEACNKYGVASRFPEIARAMASEPRTVDSEINNEAARCKDAEEQLSYFCIARMRANVVIDGTSTADADE